MKTMWIRVPATFILFLCALGVARDAWGSTIYVSAASGNDMNDGSTWALAKQTLQAGVDAATAGDTVLVTNGVYGTGGVIYPSGTALTNRVAIHKPITVRSVNGSFVTIIEGAKDPLTTNGNAAVRGVYLANGATLAGFTITNGATRYSEGDDESYGGGIWCQSANAVISNCALTGNSAVNYGGGVSGGTLYNCALTGNSAGWGGGAYGGTLYNCALTGNSAVNFGGGASRCALYNCALTGNSAVNFGGGGASICTLYNCLVYYNKAPNGANLDSSVSNNYSCTTPDPGGTGNITTAPLLLSAFHVASNSPCVGAGSANYATGADIDGNPWRAPPAMGCDEPTYPATGALTVAISAMWTNVVASNAMPFLRADIQGIPVSNRWTFGDGGTLTNQAFDVGHAWASTGLYTVVAWVWNDSNPGGVSATVQVRVVSDVYYVNVSNATPASPFDSWAKAAINIQDAVDVAPPGALILVSNGVYGVGGRSAPAGWVTNRVTIAKAVTVRGVNGPSVTMIRGAKDPLTTNGNAAVRGVYLNDGATLSGFTIANGATRNPEGMVVDCSGGGVWCQSANAVISNCVLTGNSATYFGGGGAYGGTLYNCALTGNLSSRRGGGAYGGTLYNCALTGNSADSGGGAFDCTLYNCTLTSNSADSGGGVYNGTLYNCIVYYNTAPNGANYHYDSSFDYSCTTPDPGGTGNITNDPCFVNSAGENYRLQSNSPCINTGTNQSWTIGAMDLDGNPRISPASGIVDMGAYEYLWGGSVIPSWWLEQYGLPTDGSADYEDKDGDGFNNWQEWRCDTVPTDRDSFLKFDSLTCASLVTGFVIRWASVTSRTYMVGRSTNLIGQPPFVKMETNILGQPQTTGYTDTTAAVSGPYLFYRVGVE